MAPMHLVALWVSEAFVLTWLAGIVGLVGITVAQFANRKQKQLMSQRIDAVAMMPGWD